jgi:hypothetical protein
MRISSFLWQWVEDYSFHRAQFVLDGYWHKIYIQQRTLDELQMDVPTAVAHLLRAEMDCIPEEKSWR